MRMNWNLLLMCLICLLSPHLVLGQFPTVSPITFPTLGPTQSPTTLAPTISPTTVAPTISPTTVAPTISPTTVAPTTVAPTLSPTTLTPTISPTTETPTLSPSNSPTKNPTLSPSNSPTKNPTLSPSNSPTKNPTLSPSNSPTKNPTTGSPTKNPTLSPSKNPTKNPTKNPSKSPTVSPTINPSNSPTDSPTIEVEEPLDLAIVGGAVGGFFCLAILIGLFFVFILVARKKNRRPNSRSKVYKDDNFKNSVAILEERKRMAADASNAERGLGANKARSVASSINSKTLANDQTAGIHDTRKIPTGRVSKPASKPESVISTVSVQSAPPPGMSSKRSTVVSEAPPGIRESMLSKQSETSAAPPRVMSTKKSLKVEYQKKTSTTDKPEEESTIAKTPSILDA